MKASWRVTEKGMNRLIGVSVLILLLGISGAVKAGDWGGDAEEGRSSTHYRFPQVLLLEPDAERLLEVVDVSHETTAAGRLMVRLVLKSRMKDLGVVSDVRFVFLNSSQEPEDVSAWRTIFLTPSEVQLIKCASLKFGIEDFQVVIDKVRTASLYEPSAKEIKDKKENAKPEKRDKRWFRHK